MFPTSLSIKYVTAYEVGDAFFLKKSDATTLSKENGLKVKTMRDCQQFEESGEVYYMGELLEPVFKSISEYKKS